VKPSIAIIGASTNRAKFGNRAVRAYARQGYDVYPIHPSAQAVEGHRAYASMLDVPVSRLDRVSFYVPPEIGLRVIEEVARKPVGEVWLNPGAESPELLARARSLELNMVVGCSILAIGEDPHQGA
jgi:predicted CoA-binding protein